MLRDVRFLAEVYASSVPSTINVNTTAPQVKPAAPQPTTAKPGLSAAPAPGANAPQQQAQQAPAEQNENRVTQKTSYNLTLPPIHTDRTAEHTAYNLHHALDNVSGNARLKDRVIRHLHALHRRDKKNKGL